MDQVEQRQLVHLLRQYQRLVLTADTVARGRGDRFGLCDSINNASEPYPSQWGHDLIERARRDLIADPEGNRMAFEAAPRFANLDI